MLIFDKRLIGKRVQWAGYKVVGVPVEGDKGVLVAAFVSDGQLMMVGQDEKGGFHTDRSSAFTVEGH